jgi:hypothetical protein
LNSSAAKNPTRPAKAKAVPSSAGRLSLISYVKSVNDQGRVRTSGFGHLGRRADVDTIIRDHETGKPLRRVHVPSAEPEEEKKKKPKNPRYAYLCQTDPYGILRFTYNVVTDQVSMVSRKHDYYLSETLTPEKRARIKAALCLEDLKEKGRKLAFNILDTDLSNKLDPLTRFYLQQFVEKIKIQKKVYRLYLSRLRARRAKRKVRK